MCHMEPHPRPPSFSSHTQTQVRDFGFVARSRACLGKLMWYLWDVCPLHCCWGLQRWVFTASSCEPAATCQWGVLAVRYLTHTHYSSLGTSNQLLSSSNCVLAILMPGRLTKLAHLRCRHRILLENKYFDINYIYRPAWLHNRESMCVELWLSSFTWWALLWQVLYRIRDAFFQRKWISRLVEAKYLSSISQYSWPN